jgi:hypothetical protein
LSFPLVGNPSLIQKDFRYESIQTGRTGKTDSIARNFLRHRALALIGIILFFLTGGLLLISCEGKEVKPVSQESKIAQEAIQLAETQKNAYEENDRQTLESLSTIDGYRELIGSLKTFDSAELTFTPTWIEIQDSTVKLTISWKGTWVVKGKTTEERGIAVFVLEGTPLKLAQIQRSSPFRQPE